MSSLGLILIVAVIILVIVAIVIWNMAKSKYIQPISYKVRQKYYIDKKEFNSYYIARTYAKDNGLDVKEIKIENTKEFK